MFPKKKLKAMVEHWLVAVLCSAVAKIIHFLLFIWGGEKVQPAGCAVFSLLYLRSHGHSTELRSDPFCARAAGKKGG